MTILTPQVVGASLTISDELLNGWSVMTDEDRAEYDARRAREKDEALAFLESLRAECDPVMREVLDLHSPYALEFYPECRGCDTDNYEGGSPDWPCRTVRLLAGIAGVDIPEHMR